MTEKKYDIVNVSLKYVFNTLVWKTHVSMLYRGITNNSDFLERRSVCSKVITNTNYDQSYNGISLLGSTNFRSLSNDVISILKPEIKNSLCPAGSLCPALPFVIKNDNKAIGKYLLIV